MKSDSRKPTDWHPSKVDLDFAQNVLRTVKHNGYWMIPSTGMIYNVDHVKRSLTLTTGKDSPDATQIHERTLILFARFGYDVIDNRSVTNN